MDRVRLFGVTNDPDAILVSEIEGLLENTRNFPQSAAGRRFFETLVFIKQSRYLAPFNALLVKQQRPDATFVLSREKWHQNHGRKPRSGVQPIVVMIPFGPVDFVYDIKDLEGIDAKPLHGCLPNLPTEEICRRLFPSTSPPPSLECLLDELVSNSRRQGLSFDEVPLPIQLAGRVRVKDCQRLQKKEVKPENRLVNYVMEINRNHPTEVRFAALAHELGHVYCEHLNEFDLPGFQHKSKDEVEFEAEAVAYLFCYRHGFRPQSEQYLAGYLKEGREPSVASFGVIINALKKIEDLLKPAEFSAMPRLLEISIGGFTGKSYSLTLNDNVLIYEECAPGYQPLRTVEVRPTPNQWASFWKSCHQVRVFGWEDSYDNDDVVDGDHWTVRIHLADRGVDSRGSNNYPGGNDHSDSEGYPPPFRKFLGAVSRLTNGLPFI